MRGTPSGERMETRPLYVEEWLDSLPYIDFGKTSRLLCEAIRLTNLQDLKPSVRLQLVDLYDRPYQYYVESQVRTGAHHTLQTMEAMQDQIEVLKLIAANLGCACRRVVDETPKQKSLWRQSRPPLQAMLYCLHYLAHALIFSFLEYAPVPAKIWRQLHFAYQFAEELGQAHAQLALPGAESGITTTMALAYKRIVMASLADPHHLPFGSIWEIYEKLPEWTEKVSMESFTALDNAAGYFVVNLASDQRPTPYARFDPGAAGSAHRLINAAALGELIRAELKDSNGAPAAAKRLSPYFAQRVLTHVASAWDLPPERSSPRTNRKGIIGLASGLSAAYFFLNGQQEFVSGESGEGVEVEWPEAPHEAQVQYPMDKWQLVDQARGGISLVRESKPDHGIRVGDLVVAGSTAEVKSDKPARYLPGVVRWLMIRRNRTYRMGIQFMPRPATPAAVRALSGSGVDTRFRRALLIAVPGATGQYSIITERGLHVPDRFLEIKTAAVTRKVRAGLLTEATAGFDQFRIKPA